MFATVLHHCMAPPIVQASLTFSNAILDAAALGFLGLDAQLPPPEWGTMLSDAREFVLRAWWAVTFPALALLITKLGGMATSLTWHGGRLERPAFMTRTRLVMTSFRTTVSC